MTMLSANYEKQECVGKGSFGDVYRAIERDTGRVVALKLQDLEKSVEEIETIQREIKVMRQISCPYVVQYHTSFMEDSLLWIVMEYMAGGSLKELLDAHGPFPEDAIAHVLKALCTGLEYIHRENKLHRDIKAANILVSGEGQVKLADFGVASQLTNTLRQANTFVGSPFWMAPEVIVESVYDQKADIWSVGITALELANGIPPYANQHPLQALMLIPKNDPPRLEGSSFSKTFKDFVSLCLRRRPEERLDASSLLQHPFLKRARSSAIKDLVDKRVPTTTNNASTVPIVIGGDTFTTPLENPALEAGERGGGMDTVREKKSEECSTQVFQFDFGSLGDQPENCAKQHSHANKPNAPAPVSASTPATALSAADAKKVPEQVAAQEEDIKVVKSDVLSNLFLPVLSRTRDDVAEGGTANASLTTALGALEVAFVDVENAKPGTCELLLRSLLTEACTTQCPSIMELVAQVIKSKADGHGRHGRSSRR